MHYLLFYDYVADYMERRGAFRTEHLTLAWQAHERGELMLAGVVTEETLGAVFLFQTEAPGAAEAFAAADPYVKHGLVTRWRVQAWQTAVGAGAANPVHP